MTAVAASSHAHGQIKAQKGNALCADCQSPGKPKVGLTWVCSVLSTPVLTASGVDESGAAAVRRLRTHPPGRAGVPNRLGTAMQSIAYLTRPSCVVRNAVVVCER